MSVFLKTAYLYDHYGPRLNIEQLAECLCIAKQTIRNQVSAGTFPIPTYIDQAKRFADAEDVAHYLERCRAEAA